MNEFLKKNRMTLILTSAVILLPMIAGAVLWSRLPDQLPTHFDLQGNVNGWMAKPLAVFLLPLLLEAAQWFMILMMRADPKRRNISPKMAMLTLWVIPVTSLIVHFFTYAASLKMPLDMSRLMMIFMGALLMAVGNYLPKCRQSYTVGIKLPWTLDDEENWNATHRFGGIVWVIAGLVCLILSFLPGMAVFCFWLLMIAVILPSIYSYLYYVKYGRRGRRDDKV